jgi:hypothetical protein
MCGVLSRHFSRISQSRLRRHARRDQGADTPQPPNFGGFYSSFARNAIGAPGNEMKNCIFVLGADGRPLETWTQWDELCPGVHKVRISPYATPSGGCGWSTSAAIKSSCSRTTASSC